MNQIVKTNTQEIVNSIPDINGTIGAALALEDQSHSTKLIEEQAGLAFDMIRGEEIAFLEAEIDNQESSVKRSVEPHIKLFIIMGLCTAARKTAILQLRWDQVDFNRGIINFGKSNKYKGKAQVPINSTLEQALKEHYQARTCEYVIEYASQPIKDVKRGFMAAVRRSGLKNVTPHVLRHTAAVWMAENRVPMSEISQYLGHKSTLITERVYARYSPEYLRNAARSLEIF